MPLLNRGEYTKIESLFREAQDPSVRGSMASGSRPGKIGGSDFNQHFDPVSFHIGTKIEDFSSFKNTVDNPAWLSQILKGQDATSSYSAEYHKVLTHSTAKAGYTYTKATANKGNRAWCQWDCRRFGGHTTSAFPVTFDASTADNAARQNFYSKMADKTSGMSSLPFFGELAETVRMIKRPALALRRSLDDLLVVHKKLRLYHLNKMYKDKKFLTDKARAKAVKDHSRRQALIRDARLAAQNRAAKALRTAVASSWLEWKFGAMPLASDINDAFSTFVKLMKTPVTERVSGQAERSRTSSKTVVNAAGLYYIQGDLFHKGFHLTSVAYTAGIRHRVSTSANLSSSFEFDLIDWVPAAWDLLPYSWLADYFANIGDVLDCWVESQRTQYVYCVKTVKYQSLFSWTLRPKKPGPGMISPSNFKDWTSEDGYGTCRKTQVVRTKVESVPIPSFTFRTKLSLSRDLNILALTTLKGDATRFKNRHRF